MPKTIALKPRMRDLTGKQFGSLLAIRPIGMDGKNVVWEFQCSCGKLYSGAGCWVVRQHKLATNPRAPSCGCLNKETTRELRHKHGMSAHPLFWVWVAMLERCYNPDNASYPKYGAKGVYVCQEWKTNSTAFMHWALAHGWEKGLHLDKDILCHNLGLSPHYSPKTCQFISPSENSRATKKWLNKQT
jgi:hypothetical protein